MMDECCARCRNAYGLSKFDYSNGGCEHTVMGGYVCMAFADERLAVWMIGGDPGIDRCEAFVPKEDA